MYTMTWLLHVYNDLVTTSIQRLGYYMYTMTWLLHVYNDLVTTCLSSISDSVVEYCDL